MNSTQDQSGHDHDMPPRRLRWVYLVVAYLCVALGLVGAVLPLLPATPFFLVAVWAAPRGSRRVHDWIYRQPWIARMLNQWHEQGAVPPGAKWLATLMMMASLTTLVLADAHWGLLLTMSLFFLTIGIFLWTRPNPQP